jgi:hypothetical protein
MPRACRCSISHSVSSQPMGALAPPPEPGHVPLMFLSETQIIDAAMARALHADACRDHALVAWIVMWDPPGHPERFMAQLVTKAPCPYILIGDTLAKVKSSCRPAWRERPASRSIRQRWWRSGSRNRRRAAPDSGERMADGFRRLSRRQMPHSAGSALSACTADRGAPSAGSSGPASGPFAAGWPADHLGR